MVRIGAMMAINAKHLLGTIAASLETVINREHPLLEGELLLDGFRVADMLLPIVGNPSFAIWKKAALVFPLDRYVAQGAMSAAQREAILSAIRGSAPRECHPRLAKEIHDLSEERKRTFAVGLNLGLRVAQLRPFWSFSSRASRQAINAFSELL